MMVRMGMVKGIILDADSNKEFCEACAKAKLAQQPYLHESKTRATKYGECVHWDLWGLASVMSLGGKLYATVRMDNATQEVKVYFQVNKSETFETYTKDETWIRTHKGKWARMD
jgi:hypothetical protein